MEYLDYLKIQIFPKSTHLLVYLKENNMITKYVTLDSTLKFDGNLNQTKNSTITFDFKNCTNISICLTLQGEIEIIYDPNLANNNSLTLFSHNCSTPVNNLDIDVTLKSTQDKNACNKAQPILNSNADSISVSFAYNFTCKRNIGFIVGLSVKNHFYCQSKVYQGK